MPPAGFERSSSPPNIIQTPIEETLTIGEMSTQSVRRQLRKPPTVWRLSLFETGQDKIIEVPEGQARIYIIGDADAWSVVGMLYHPKITTQEASGAPPLIQFGVQGIPAPKEKGVMLYNIGDMIDVQTYKPIRLTVETCPEQTADEDPKRWIMEETAFLTPHAAAVSSTRLEVIKQHRGRARLGEIGLIVQSKVVTDKKSETQEEVQMGRIRAAVATGSLGTAAMRQNRHIDRTNTSGFNQFTLVRMDTITLYRTQMGRYGKGFNVPTERFKTAKPWKKPQRVIERIYGIPTEMRKIVTENQHRWEASVTDKNPRERLDNPAQALAIAKFAKKWPILKDVTSAVVATERALTEMQMIKAKVQVIVDEIMEDHTWKFRVDVDNYAQSHNLVKQAAEEFLFKQNSPIVFCYEEDGKKHKLFEAILTSTQYRRVTKPDADGKVTTTTMSDLLTARRQISYFGKTRAAKPAEETTTQGNLHARPPPVSKSISEHEDGEASSSESDTDEDEEAQLETEEDLHDIEPLTKLNVFDTVAKIKAKLYNIPKKDDYQLFEDLQWPPGVADTDGILRAKCYIVPSALFPQVRTRSNALRELDAMPTGAPEGYSRDTIMYIFNGIEIAPHEDCFVNKKHYQAVKPWDYEIPEQNQEDDKAYRLSPQNLYSDILGIEMLESADFDKWIFDPERSFKTNTKSNSQQNTAAEGWSGKGGWSDSESEQEVADSDVEGDDVMDDSTYEPVMIFSKEMEDLMTKEGTKACRKIMYTIYETIKKARRLASPLVMPEITFKEIARKEIGAALHLTPKENREVFKDPRFKLANTCLNVAEGFEMLMQLWSIKFKLGHQNKDTEDEEWTSLLSDTIDEDQLNDEEKADRAALKQSQKIFANIFVESWNSIWNDITQEAIKKDAFRTQDVLYRKGTRLPTQGIIEVIKKPQAQERPDFWENMSCDYRNAIQETSSYAVQQPTQTGSNMFWKDFIRMYYPFGNRKIALVFPDFVTWNMGINYQAVPVCPNAIDWTEYRAMIRTGKWHDYEEVLFAIRYNLENFMD